MKYSIKMAGGIRGCLSTVVVFFGVVFCFLFFF